MWEALQHTGWVTLLATSRWLYGLVSVVHYSAVFFCVGTIVLLDLRILGVAYRNQAPSVLAEQLRPWTWIGFGAVAVSGFLLFAVDAGNFAAVAPFCLKRVVIFRGVVFLLAIDCEVSRGEPGAVLSVAGRGWALLFQRLFL